MSISIKSAFVRIIIMIVLSSPALAGLAQSYLQNPAYGETEQDRTKCASNLSTMSEFVKISMYDYAYEAWRYCYNNCPAASKNIYIMGAKILRHKIENTADKEVAGKYLDSLMLLYDQRIKYFHQEGYVLGWKGIDLLKYKPEEIQQGYDILKKSMELDNDKTEPAVFVTFIQASHVLYNNNNKPADEFINDYVKATDLISKALKNPSNKNNLDNYNTALASVESIFAESGAADCNALIAIYSPKFKATPDDVELLKKITDILNNSKCTDAQLFADASEHLFKLEPSAIAAFNIGVLFESKGELEKAKKYFAIAGEQETNPEDKAHFYYREAAVVYQQGNYAEAKSLALKALNYKPDYGEAYILIGTAYVAGNSSCSSDEFEKATVYWAAIDKFNKAKSVDQSVTEKANDYIAKYSIYFPTKEELFFRNLNEGNSYTIGCWINETTTVRARKN